MPIPITGLFQPSGGAGAFDLYQPEDIQAGNINVVLQAITGGSFKGGSHATSPAGEIVVQVKTTTGAPSHSASLGTLCWNSVDQELYSNINGSTGWAKVTATHAALPNAHHAESHTLASHSTRAHSELTGVGAADHVHDVLSAGHGDSLAGSVVAGDLIVGNATPKWARLAKGTTNYVLKAGASVLAWGQVAFSELTGTLSDTQHGSRTQASAHRHGDVDVANPASLKQTLALTAGGGAPTTTSGCGGPTKNEAATNDVDYWSLDFDQTTQEYAFWGPIPLPDNYDGGTLTAVFHWTAGSGSGGVRWGIALASRADDEAIDQAWGTAQEVSDTLLAAGDEHVSAATAAITPAGTPAGGEMLFIRVYRLPSHGDDTLTADARLIAVKLEYGVNALSA